MKNFLVFLSVIFAIHSSASEILLQNGESITVNKLCESPEIVSELGLKKIGCNKQDKTEKSVVVMDMGEYRDSIKRSLEDQCSRLKGALDVKSLFYIGGGSFSDYTLKDRTDHIVSVGAAVCKF